jgi:hypothetical protein
MIIRKEKHIMEGIKKENVGMLTGSNIIMSFSQNFLGYVICSSPSSKTGL